MKSIQRLFVKCIFFLGLIQTETMAAEPIMKEEEILKREVIVEIIQDEKVVSWGSGVLMNNHNVITAAHVVDQVKDGERIRVLYKGHQLSVDLVDYGDRYIADIALLRLYERDVINMPVLELKSLKICSTELIPGQAVYALAAGAGFETAGAVNPNFITYSLGVKSTSHISAFMDPGASGGGVFDTQHSCLIGIVSQQDIRTANTGRIRVFDYGTKITGSVVINEFLNEVKKRTDIN